MSPHDPPPSQTLHTLHTHLMPGKAKRNAQHRNPLRGKLSPRRRWLKHLDDIMECHLKMAYQRRPVSLPYPLLFQGLLKLRNQVKTARYLVKPKYKRVLYNHYRTKVLSGKDKDYFKDTFRMNKAQFHFIVELIKDATVFKSRGKKPQKPVMDQLKVALHRFCHDGSLSSRAAVGRQLGISVGSVGRFTRRCASALCSLKDAYVKWPSEREKIKVKQRLGKGRFRHAIGAVDGTMIPLFRAPTFDRNTFATRKSNFSMDATGVCDHRGVFTFFYTGYVGTRHDSAAYKDMPLYQKKGGLFFRRRSSAWRRRLCFDTNRYHRLQWKTPTRRPTPVQLISSILPGENRTCLWLVEGSLFVPQSPSNGPRLYR